MSLGSPRNAHDAFTHRDEITLVVEREALEVAERQGPNAEHGSFLDRAARPRCIVHGVPRARC
jgi:hypothetical protein